jgi:hypothetical protein
VDEAQAAVAPHRHHIECRNRELPVHKLSLWLVAEMRATPLAGLTENDNLALPRLEQAEDYLD